MGVQLDPLSPSGVAMSEGGMTSGVWAQTPGMRRELTQLRTLSCSDGSL